MRKLTFLLFLLVPIGLWAQDIQVIKGKVINRRTKEALPGVSIYIDNTTIGLQQQEGVVSNYQIGTVSDTDGNFSLKIPRTVKQVTFSMIGFENQVLALTEIDSYTVKMEESFTEINEVMITGYQKIPKSKVTGAMEKIYSKEILQQSTPNIDEMLKGQMAGVQIESTSGAPGAPARIRIRGTATLGGKTDPLWVLDGMPLEGDDVPDMEGKDIDQLVNTSIAGINPADIESITILKDAAATAIYGARAANGVIVITTKQGEKGSIRVNAATNWFVNSRPDMDRLHLLNSNQKVDLELALAVRPDLTYRNDKGQVARILNNANEFDLYQSGGFNALSSETQSLINALRNTNTNWGDELYQTALSQNHTLSISGGSDKAKYYFSTGYYNEEGTTTGTSMNRLNLTLKTDFQVKDWLNFGISVFANQRKQESYLTGTDSFTNPSRYSRNTNPYLPVYNEDGTYAYDPEIDGYSDRYIDYNIIEERENTSKEQTVFNTITIFDLKIDFTKDLNLTSQFGFTTDRLSNEKTANKESYYARKQREMSKRYKNGESYYFLPEGGVVKNQDQYTYQWNSKTMLNYSREFNGEHDIEVLVGAEFRRNKTTIEISNAYGFDKDTYNVTPIIFPSVSDAENFPLYSKEENTNTFTSFFGTANYTFRHKYSVSGSLRYDGSNIFGIDPKYRYLPIYSVGLAWNIGQEEWLQDADWLTFLKTRLSYGLQGNIDKNTPAYVVGDYDQATILPGNTEQTVGVSSPPNDKLKWEKTTSWNLGIDLGLFHNRISATADLYHRRSVHLIAAEVLPLETGFISTSRNWGEITNKGIELTLTTDNIRTRDFKWATTINIAKNINRVKKVNIREDKTTPSTRGYSINTIFALPTNGLDDQGYPIFVKDGQDYSVSEFFDLSALWGIPELVASNLSNAEIRSLYKVMGSTDPKFSGGIINEFSYKNWDLKVAANFYLKQWRKETPFYSMTQYDRGQNTTESIYDVWSPDSPNGKYPGIVGPYSYDGERALDYYWMTGAGQTVNTFNDLDIWYKEMSYIRINSIRLGYSLPASICSKMGLVNAKVNLEAKNPFVIGTGYSGYFDPETYGNIYSQPIAKSYMIGLNLTF